MSGTIIRTPTMSMNAVTISTVSLATDGLTRGLSAPPSVMRSIFQATQRGGRHGARDDPGESDDREQVRNHLDELGRHELGALKLDLKRFGCREQQAGDAYQLRLPSS